MDLGNQKKLVILDEAARYSREELFSLWKSFCNDRHAAEMLADFGLLDRYQAQRLVIEFWQELDNDVMEKPIYSQAKHNDADFEW